MIGYSAGELGMTACFVFATAVLPVFLAQYALPNWLIGLLAQERPLLGAGTQLLAGTLSDKLPRSALGRRRPFFLFGVGGTIITLWLMSGHPGLVEVIALAAAFSLFLSVAYAPYQAILIDLVPVDQRGSVGATMAFFRVAGQTLIVVLGAVLWDSHRSLTFLAAAAILAGSSSVTMTIREPQGAAAHDISRRFALRQYLADLRHRDATLRVLLVTALFWLAMGGVIPFITRFGVDTLHASDSMALLLFLPAGLGMAGVAVAIRFFGRWETTYMWVAGGMFLVSVATMISAAAVQSLGQAMVATLCVGVGFGAVSSLAFPLFSEAVPADRAGEFTGMANALWSFVQPVGAAAAGLLIDHFGSIRLAFAAASVVVLAASILMLRKPQRERGFVGERGESKAAAAG